MHFLLLKDCSHTQTTSRYETVSELVMASCKVTYVLFSLTFLEAVLNRNECRVSALLGIPNFGLYHCSQFTCRQN